jgi:hypothetical protein
VRCLSRDRAAPAVLEDDRIAIELWYGISRIAGRRDGLGQHARLVVEEPSDRAQIILDLGAPGAGGGVVEQAQ